MTPVELKQPREVFVRAGKNSFLLGISNVMDCPYKDQPFKSLWEKGFRAQKKRHEQKFYTKKTAWK